jgi:hypothetical protein
MEKLNLAFITVCLFGFVSVIQAQNVIPASGGNATRSGGTVSYSVGQVFYTSNTSSSGSVAQGVQQPYEISLISFVEQAENINLLCSAYPNPFTDFLTLKIENYDNQDLAYQLFDINGIALGNNKITGFETVIVMGSYLSGTYFLKVTNAGKKIKTFKIIKK